MQKEDYTTAASCLERALFDGPVDGTTVTGLPDGWTEGLKELLGGAEMWVDELRDLMMCYEVIGKVVHTRLDHLCGQVE